MTHPPIVVAALDRWPLWESEEEIQSEALRHTPARGSPRPPRRRWERRVSWRLRAIAVWAQGRIQCPNSIESTANPGNPSQTASARWTARFRLTIRFRLLSDRSPGPACHAEGRGFESHHPLLLLV